MNLFNQRNDGLRLVVLMAVMLGLGGCSLFGSKDDKQGDAQSMPPLEVPPDLITPAANPRFQPLTTPSSTASKAASNGTMSASQPVMTSGNEVMPQWQGVERMRDGQQRWLLVNADADQVWSQVQQFFQERGYDIAQDEPTLGFMETAWKDRAEAEEGSTLQGWRESWRVRVEPATQAGKTEIHLSHKSSELVAGQWQLRTADTDRAIEMLNRLARFLAENKVVPVQSAAPPKATPTVELEPARDMTEAEKATIDNRWKEIEEECAVCRPR